MQGDQRRGSHRRRLLEQSMDVLFGHGDFAVGFGVCEVPGGGGLVQAQRAEH
jgi:hypothetical protein